MSQGYRRRSRNVHLWEFWNTITCPSLDSYGILNQQVNIQRLSSIFYRCARQRFWQFHYSAFGSRFPTPRGKDLVGLSCSTTPIFCIQGGSTSGCFEDDRVLRLAAAEFRRILRLYLSRTSRLITLDRHRTFNFSPDIRNTSLFITRTICWRRSRTWQIRTLFSSRSQVASLHIAPLASTCSHQWAQMLSDSLSNSLVHRSKCG